MATGSNNRIDIKMDYSKLKGASLQELLKFCFDYTDMVSLCQSANIGMTKEEALHAAEAYYEYLEMSGMEADKRPSMEEMIELYQDMAESEEELKELISREKSSRERYDSRYKKTNEEVAEYIQSLFAGYQLQGREVTCMTPSTMGEPCTLYYLKPEEELKARFYEMDDLFQAVIADESMELLLEDPVFYHKGEILLLVCTHENHASLRVTEEQYEEFQKLRIPYLVI